MENRGASHGAEDYATAYLEKFGFSEAGQPKGLSGADLALRTPGSFTQIRLNMKLENVLDISDHATLKPMVEILRNFEMPKSVNQTARKLGLKRAPWLIRSSTSLQKQLLHSNWRVQPMQFDLPGNSQIFGRWVAAAGIHGILFPSSRDLTKRCLALFPQNWGGSTSYLEIADAVPAGVWITRIDGRFSA
ncbi:MAG TPA: RES family NAD+ phosphorylase [Steroidobacteraceae bacterium]|nr:RES family NAD+ phosphorylase [Steroidobacteraceae bacterium]